MIIKKELDDLSKMLDDDKRGIYDYSVRLGLSYDGKTRIMLDAKIKKMTLLNRLKYLAYILRIIGRIPTSTRMIKNDFGLYVLENRENLKKFEINISTGMEKNFALKADKLINSDFSTEMAFTDEELDDIVCSDSGHIWETFPDYSQSFSNLQVVLTYNGLADELEMSSIFRRDERPGFVTADVFQTVLDTEIPKRALSEYHKRVIDNGLAYDKEIIFSDDYVPDLHSKFAIEEEGKQIVLHKLNNTSKYSSF